MAETLGGRIKSLRLARGLAQPDLAARVGISQPSLSNIERNKTEKLRGDTLAGLCRELGVTPDVLLRGTTTRNPESVLHEAEIMGLWRQLTDDDQVHLLAIARALAQRRAPLPRTPPAAPEQPRKGAAAQPFPAFTTQHGRLTET